MKIIGLVTLLGALVVAWFVVRHVIWNAIRVLATVGDISVRAWRWLRGHKSAWEVEE